MMSAQTLGLILLGIALLNAYVAWHMCQRRQKVPKSDKETNVIILIVMLIVSFFLGIYANRWLAPTNWVSPTEDQTQWEQVERVEEIEVG